MPSRSVTTLSVGGASVPTGFTGAAWIRLHRQSARATHTTAAVGAASAATSSTDTTWTVPLVGGTSVPTGFTGATCSMLHQRSARVTHTTAVVGAASAATGLPDTAWTTPFVGGTSVPTGFTGTAWVGKQKQKLSPDGESLFFACAKKSNQKKPLYSSRMADQAHPAAAPATRVRSASGIFGRGLSASQPSPGQSPRGASPPAGAKQCFAFYRRALPRPKTAHVLVRRPPAGGFARQLRRCGGDPGKAKAEEQQQQQRQRSGWNPQ
ncbi:hypothetical protein GGR66_000215 [Xanthomonas sp. 3498]|nr:hypothetical protein [Xanthomonas sp. 3498]